MAGRAAVRPRARPNPGGARRDASGARVEPSRATRRYPPMSCDTERPRGAPMLRPRPVRVVPALLLAALAAPSSLAAQDFLFGAPHGSVTFRVGRLFARSEGEVFEHTFRNLTVEPDDLDAVAFGADLALRVAERADVVVGAGFSWTSIRSEFHDWVDQDDQPIRQTTRFRQ